MWLEAGVAFVTAIGVGAVAGRRRGRRRASAVPPELQGFLERFREELQTRHPTIELRGLVPGKFAAVLRIEGQELPVSLHPLYRRCAAFPHAFSESVDRFLSEVGGIALERTGDHGFSDVATSILPQVRSRAWLRERSPAFGDSALVHREFAEDLVICYVIDDPWSMTFVCQAHLHQWSVTEEDLFHLTTRNLQRLAGVDVPLPDDEQNVLVRTGDGFDAARVLLLDPESVEGLLVAIPERDLLWIGNEDNAQLPSLMKMTAEQNANAEHPVSSTVYRMQQGKLVAVNDSDSAT